MLEQSRARLGRRDRAACQQRGAEVGLEHPDVLGDRRLRVAELIAPRARTSRAGRPSRRCAETVGPSGSLIRLPQKIIGRDRRAARACGHGNRETRPRGGPLPERPRPRPHPAADRGAAQARRPRPRPVLDSEHRRRRPAGLRRHLGRPGQPVHRPGQGRRRRQDGARTADPVPRHVRRLPARDPRARGVPGRHVEPPPRRVRHLGRRDHRRVGVLAGRPRGADRVHAGDADPADRRASSAASSATTAPTGSPPTRSPRSRRPG